MAQTVALQRGTGTVGVNGSATLFTQSGGISTRVILNQLAFYAGGTWASPSMTLVHVVSNGSTNLIGWWRAPSGSSGQLCPNPNGSGPTQSTMSWNSASATALSASANGGYLTGNSTTYPGSSFQPSIPALYTNYYSMNYGSYAPQNFWIGPSDSLLFRAYDYTLDRDGGGGNGATYAYHFTTITES
jgi:hypothetical protein